jgi:two-component system chemotaxis response regulator CheY
MKILVVDDSRAMRSIVLRACREMGLRGHTFLEASNGREALQTICESKPELVVCDVNMPEMSGLELLRMLKERGSSSRFGFVTSELSSKLKSEAEAAGAVFVITKPFTIANFSRAVGPVVESLGSGPLEDYGEASVETPPAGSGAFNASQVARMLTSLTRRGVRTVSVPPMQLPPRSTHFVAEYLVDRKSVAACAITDLAFAVHVGAALTLIPTCVATESIGTGQLTESIDDNFREVLNVTSRFFGATEKEALSLGKVYRPGEPPPVELRVRLRQPVARIDLRVVVDTYGEGSLTLVTLPVV